MKAVTKFFIIAFCVALLTACDSVDVIASIEEYDISDVAIVPEAGVGVSVTSRAPSLNGNIDDTSFRANTDDVFAVTALIGKNGPEKAYFANAAVDCDSEGKFKFSSDKYYYLNGVNHYFYAYSPAAAGSPVYPDMSSSTPTVEFTIDGQQDIMWAKDERAISYTGDTSTQLQPSFNFKHLLKKIRFKFIIGDGFARNVDVTTVRIVGLHERLSINLLTGELTPKGDLTGTAEIHGTWAINPKEYSVELPNLCLMCEPGDKISIEIIAAQYKYEVKDLVLTSGNENITPGGPGVSHLVTIEFHAIHVNPSSEIENSWDDSIGENTGNI